MPVYNGEKYLRQAIDSILNQSFSDFELILVNDGSTDSTPQIINSYNDKRIVLINQKNQGVARSLNNGLKMAIGEYVRRHDADDISSTESLQIQVDFLDNNPDYVMVSNQQAFMTSNGKIARNYKLPHDSFFVGKEKTDLNFDHFSLSSASPVVHGTACYRRKEVLEMGSYRPEFIVSEDNDLWIRLIEKYKVAILNKCTYFMRIHPQSATHVHSDKINFFRKLLLDYSRERRENGSDPLMRNEEIQQFHSSINKQNLASSEKIHDEKRWFYSFLINAKDYKLAFNLFFKVVKREWKNIQAWKMLLFPLLGQKLVNAGVKIKSSFYTNQHSK